jgi:hypothetical protein
VRNTCAWVTRIIRAGITIVKGLGREIAARLRVAQILRAFVVVIAGFVYALASGCGVAGVNLTLISKVTILCGI